MDNTIAVKAVSYSKIFGESPGFVDIKLELVEGDTITERIYLEEWEYIDGNDISDAGYKHIERELRTLGYSI